jgi:hypothetical protein
VLAVSGEAMRDLMGWEEKSGLSSDNLVHKITSFFRCQTPRGRNQHVIKTMTSVAGQQHGSLGRGMCESGEADSNISM